MTSEADPQRRCELRVEKFGVRTGKEEGILEIIYLRLGPLVLVEA